MRAWFFDMDGTLFDSMPHHALSWERTMAANGLVFSIEDCYRNEGRTGSDVISTAIRQQLHREATEEEKSRIYAEKAAMFRQMGGAEPIKGVKEVLQYLKDKGDEIWIVTGSGQQSLFDTLESHFPGIFARERMMVENAPLGIRAGKAAGLFTIGINTGPLPDADLQNEGADIVLPDMRTLLDRLQKNDN